MLESLAKGLAGPGVLVFEGGRDGGSLWAPYAKAKDAVERYAQDPQEPGCQVDLLRYEPGKRRLDLYLLNLALPSKCPRFASRACPKMEPMGHEPRQATCNYWDYPRMNDFAPGIELYPEWQRFDCHKFYPLFQLHLVGEELAAGLGAEAFFTLLSPEPAHEKLVSSYAALSSRPAAFSWRHAS